MSETANIQVVKDAYTAYLRGDIQAVIESLSDNVEWVAPAIEPVAGTYRGPNDVATFFRKVNETSEFSSFDSREFIAQGDRVVVLGRYKGTARATGRVYDCEWAMAFTVVNGKISKFQEYTDTAAIAAALPATSTATA